MLLRPSGGRTALCVLVLLCAAPLLCRAASKPVPARSQTTPSTPAVLPAAVPPPIALRDPQSLSVLITGMIQFTRWPSSAPTVRLCVMGHDALVEQLRAVEATAIKPRTLITHAIKVDSDARNDCDAVYFAALPAESTRLMVRQLVGQPILTLGDQSEFCSDGGLFCLDPSSGAVLRFYANLDSIARSRLHVNPRVLQLARPRESTTP